MSAFDKIKQGVKTDLHDFEVKAETEVKSNRGWIISFVVGFLLGLILPHVL